MKPFFAANGVTIYHGDCRDILRQLPSESVHCVVTSPPYWGLRDYGNSPSVWPTPMSRGIVRCNNGDHVWKSERYYTEQSAAKVSGEAFSEAGEANADRLKKARWREDSFCELCGAWKGCFGLEPTPKMYVEHGVGIFRELRRVLRNDATLWLNMGDSYTSGGRSTHGTRIGYKQETNVGCLGVQELRPELPIGMKPKDLCGIPWMLAFALREDGWYLRQDIIWSKANPMPESVTDRCTKAHEYLFLLSKSERYFYNADAIKEPSVTNDIRRPYGSEGAWAMDGRPDEQRHGGEPRSFKGSKFNTGKTAVHQLGRSSDNPRVHGNLPGRSDNGAACNKPGQEFRNKRSVWEVTTQPFPEAHFATFPEDLIKPCILAGCPEGGTVLDPFGGAGTTGLVARKLHSKAILLELNQEYIEISARRLSQEVFNFGDVAGSSGQTDPVDRNSGDAS